MAERRFVGRLGLLLGDLPRMCVVDPELMGYNPGHDAELCTVVYCREGAVVSCSSDGEAMADGAMTYDGIRIGLGHDTHRVGAGGPLRLGGIDIPSDLHLIGHSDADVLLHAVTDALLGAAALGDIGDWFPDTDLDNRGRDSTEMLLAAYREVRKQGFQLVNLDCIIFAQRPKLTDYKPRIRDQLAHLLEVAPDRIGVKAKTGERVGPVGREEALMAECVVLIAPSEEPLRSPA